MGNFDWNDAVVELKLEIAKLFNLAQNLTLIPFHSGEWGELFKAVMHLVGRVEQIGSELLELTGDKKKALIVNVLNELINIPFVPEKIEGMLLGAVIDAVVFGYNQWFGKKWLDKIEVS